MKHGSKIVLASLAALGMAPVMASAEVPDASEIALFRSATISVQTAGETALATRSGALAGVQFGDENGIGIFEALIVDPDGTPWKVKVDAMTGEVLAQGKAAVMDEDSEDHDSAEAEDESDDGYDEADEG